MCVCARLHRGRREGGRGAEREGGRGAGREEGRKGGRGRDALHERIATNAHKQRLPINRSSSISSKVSSSSSKVRVVVVVKCVIVFSPLPLTPINSFCP